jgi:hypothetical protein
MRDLNEPHVIDILNKIEFRGGNFTKSTDIYEHYDAENFKNILEIKVRNQDYDKHIIERFKYERNIEHSLVSGRTFFYVSIAYPYLYAWDITYLDKINYNYFWKTKKLNKTKMFDDNSKIPKVVGYLEKPFSLCINLNTSGLA